jgi:protein-S-isoprenylcysteine O-methyltransferase Ste14
MLLDRIGWLACVVYATIPLFWLAIHPRVEYWRSCSRSPYRVLIPLWIGMWLAFGAVTSPWRDLWLHHSRWTWVPAAILFGLGLWIYRRSGVGFSSAQLGGLPEVMFRPREQRLAVSGIRTRVRHPIYLAHLCEMVAWSVGTGLVVCYCLTVFAVLSGAIMIHFEDKELEQRFGEEYREYRQNVPAILPRI